MHVAVLLGFILLARGKKDKIIALYRTQCLEVGGGDKTADGVFLVDESCGGNKTRKRHWGEKLQLLLWRSGKLQHILKDISPVS